ncbi:glycosyltransferase [Prevotella communis]|uniref:glycosyltransferase family 2 protein n=1 Tax=Prevotella communis TaxID=2913614 RepID=UPI001EDA18A7|nr:glycosyltransferase [Prevotella communis]UKK61054.1 glycosyltransferase [Prevotella communis]UKK63879.1 glycosyltransferase [Prevotella communis]
MDVSVIIPVYNTEKYLNACVDSILLQADVSLEIILVDDGSTDASPIICDDYAQKHENIHVLHIQNSGPATAKNEGLKLAKGNYIALTDSDDRMEPLMLNKMVSAGYEYDADIVCCNYKQIDEQGNVSHLNSTNQQYVLNHEEGLIHFFSKDKIYSQCWTKLYKRQMLTDNHIENDSGLRTDEDFIFNIRAFVHAKTTVIVDEPLYEYTHRENSLAHAYFKSHIYQYIDNRIQRVKVTQNAVKNESDTIKHWSTVHIIMYHNELLGKVALFPEYYADPRIKEILRFIKRNKSILNQHYALCGFSKIGKMLITYLPSCLYMKYRKSKV